MSDFVELYLEAKPRVAVAGGDSYGLTPMFGEDGWCHACGTPLREQCGSVILQRKGFKSVEGAWVPNWRFDVYCVDQGIAEQTEQRFAVTLLPVEWHGISPGPASQIVIPTVGESWFDPDELRAVAIAEHGTAGAECADCGTWRWMPLTFRTLRQLRVSLPLGDVDIAASPEWFGDGWQSFRQILVRRELAQLIAEASPKDFKIREI